MYSVTVYVSQGTSIGPRATNVSNDNLPTHLLCWAIHWVSVMRIAYCIRTSPSRWFLRRKQARRIWQMALLTMVGGCVGVGGDWLIAAPLLNNQCNNDHQVKSWVIIQRFTDTNKILLPGSVSGGVDHNKGSSKLYGSCSEICGVSLMTYLINNRLYQRAIVVLPIGRVHLWFEKLSTFQLCTYQFNRLVLQLGCIACLASLVSNGQLVEKSFCGQFSFWKTRVAEQARHSHPLLFPLNFLVCFGQKNPNLPRNVVPS